MHEASLWQILTKKNLRELKTVTNWFQNKRQTEKKKSLVWRADGHRLSPATGPVAYQSSQLQSIVSLDRIAGLHEKPTGPITIPNALPQTPLTPRNTNRQVNTSLEYDQLWQHMPSSPLIPPSSPAADSARMSILPSRSKTMKSLEWACAKARAGRYEEGDEELGCIPEAESVEQSCEDMLTDDETDTESELDEVVTPDGSTNFSPGFVIPEDSTVPHWKKNTGTKLFAGHQQEDLDAAVALIGFMGRR